MLQYYHYSNIEGCGCWQLIAWLQRGTEHGLNVQIRIVLGLAPFKDAGRGGGTRLVWNSFSSDQYKPYLWGVACERCTPMKHMGQSRSDKKSSRIVSLSAR